MAEDNIVNMTSDTMLEKVVRLETRNEAIKEQLSLIDKKVTDIGGKIDNINLLQQEILVLRREFEEYKRSHIVSSWLYPILAAIVGATLAVLFQVALTKK